MSEDNEDAIREIRQWIDPRIVNTTSNIISAPHHTDDAIRLFSLRFQFEWYILHRNMAPEALAEEALNSNMSGDVALHHLQVLAPYGLEALCVCQMSQNTETILTLLQHQSQMFREGNRAVAEVRIHKNDPVECAVLFAYCRSLIEFWIHQLFTRGNNVNPLILHGTVMLMQSLETEKQRVFSSEEEPPHHDLLWGPIIHGMSAQKVSELLDLALYSDAVHVGSAADTCPSASEATEGSLEQFITQHMESIDDPDFSFTVDTAERVLQRIFLWITIQKCIALPLLVFLSSRDSKSRSCEVWHGWLSCIGNALRLPTVSTDSSPKKINPLPLEEKLFTQFASTILKYQEKLRQMLNTKTGSTVFLTLSNSLDTFVPDCRNVPIWLGHLTDLLTRSLWIDDY